MSKPFVFQFKVPEKTVEKPLVDADGVPIELGSILRHEDGRCRGVVTWIGYPDQPRGHMIWGAPPLSQTGDIQVYEGRGISRISNQFGKFRHIPREETTYWERYTSWLKRPFNYEAPDPDVSEENRISKGEALACDGIMAMLPNDPVDWEYGDWPDRIEVALRYLLDHFEELEKRCQANPSAPAASGP